MLITSLPRQTELLKRAVKTVWIPVKAPAQRNAKCPFVDEHGEYAGHRGDARLYVSPHVLRFDDKRAFCFVVHNLYRWEARGNSSLPRTVRHHELLRNTKARRALPQAA
ncbi:hypothetical protein HRbin21_00895 [bacterium HR21]|nr:hypothetical protein HRbin21_00895 [bacterium HR21]